MSKRRISSEELKTLSVAQLDERLDKVGWLY